MEVATLEDNATEYWYKHYCAEHCTLCGNIGVIDTRNVRTRAGVVVGRLNWCICPNGQKLRAAFGALKGERARAVLEQQLGRVGYEGLPTTITTLEDIRKLAASIGCPLLSSRGAGPVHTIIEVPPVYVERLRELIEPRRCIMHRIEVVSMFKNEVQE